MNDRDRRIAGEREDRLLSRRGGYRFRSRLETGKTGRLADHVRGFCLPVPIEAVPNQSTLFLMKVGTSRSSSKSLELLFE